MKLALYTKFRNSAGERVRIALAIKEIDYVYVSVGSNGQIAWDRYKEINPQGLMPTLAVRDKLFSQATAILEYLEEAYPEPRLLPIDPVHRAEARAFAQYIVSEMHSIDVIRVRRFLSNNLDVDERGITSWQSHWSRLGFGALEQTLERRAQAWPFCFGENAGWADLHLVPQMRKVITRFGLNMKDYPLLSGVYQRCISLPAFVAASPSAQMDFKDNVGEPPIRRP
jgi:maleylacetoacetate isomerase